MLAASTTTQIDWGSFSPNLSGGWGSFGGSGSSSFGSFSSSGFYDSGRQSFYGGDDGGGSGGWGGFTPTNDGFSNSEPLGGYAGTSPSFNSITDLNPVEVVGPKPGTGGYNPNTVAYDPTIHTLDRVSVVEDYNPVDRPYDPSIPTLDRVAAVPPDVEKGLTEQQWRDWLGQEQVKVFSPFTGPIGATYDFIKAVFSGDWWGAGLMTAGVFAPVLRVGKYGGAGYQSFDIFKRVHGKAEPGFHWHHLVEQNPTNLSRFGPHRIHNIDNMVQIDARTHARITADYNRIDPLTGQRMRDTMSQLPYDEQYRKGLEITRKYSRGAER